MLSIYCDTDNWNPTLETIIKENPELNNLDVHFSVNSISYDSNKKYNILILQESPAVLKTRNIINFVEDEHECGSKYYKVYTCIQKLQYLKYVEYCHPSNISWINTPRFLPSKTKLISMVSSSNSFLDGHKFRLNVLNSVKSFVDIYGRNINPIKNKEDGLKNYYYSIAIENDNTDNYFSEKILDCFMTCTIPIYWGTEYVNEVFNSKGILNLKTFTDLSEIKKLDKTYYCDNTDAVVENYFLAQKENRYLNHLLKNILFKLYIKNYQ